jgi:Trp operon repressor
MAGTKRDIKANLGVGKGGISRESNMLVNRLETTV